MSFCVNLYWFTSNNVKICVFEIHPKRSVANFVWKYWVYWVYSIIFPLCKCCIVYTIREYLTECLLFTMLSISHLQRIFRLDFKSHLNKMFSHSLKCMMIQRFLVQFVKAHSFFTVFVVGVRFLQFIVHSVLFFPGWLCISPFDHIPSNCCAYNYTKSVNCEYNSFKPLQK